MRISDWSSDVCSSDLMTVTGIFLVIAAANVIAAYYVCKLLPTELMKGIAAGLLRLCYRVEVHGREHITAAGAKAVIVVNHVFFLDGALLAAFLPGPPVFAIDPHTATRWSVRPFPIRSASCRETVGPYV